MPSMSSVALMMYWVSRTTPETETWCSSCCMTNRSLSLIFLPIKRAISVAMVMHSESADLNEADDDQLPEQEKRVPVSTTFKPVTQAAEVAVNRASIKPTLSPEAEAPGVVSSKAPTRIIPAKPRARIW